MNKEIRLSGAGIIASRARKIKVQSSLKVQPYEARRNLITQLSLKGKGNAILVSVLCFVFTQVPSFLPLFKIICPNFY